MKLDSGCYPFYLNNGFLYYYAKNTKEIKYMLASHNKSYFSPCSDDAAGKALSIQRLICQKKNKKNKKLMYIMINHLIEVMILKDSKKFQLLIKK